MFRNIFFSCAKALLLISSILLVEIQVTGQQFDQLLNEIESEDKKDRSIHGVVTQQNKYSIVVRSGDQSFEIKLPETVPIARELIRPKFDLENSKLQMTLPCTGPGGDQSKNQLVELPLFEKTYLVATFNSETNLTAFFNKRTNLISRYSLFDSEPENLGPLQISGELKQIDQGFVLATDVQQYPVELGARENLLAGFSILDLEPGTEISVDAMFVEDEWVAQKIQFQKVPQQGEPNSDLPRILSIGDMVSFSYQRALHERFDQKFVVMHPPTNCGNSNNWPLLHRWLGDYSERQWDVILFNTGMLDHQLSKEAYQENLKHWVETIRPAGKRLIWLTTTPVQGAIVEPIDNLTGKVPGRMKLQNRWAAEVLSEYPQIEICDLWQTVVDGRDADFKDWWNSTRPQFNYKQSKKVAEAIAEAIGD